MTHDQIEIAVQRKVDRLDALYTAPGSTMTQAEYDEAQRAIDRWAEWEYRFAHYETP
jgi:hypothetical protein